eukprot:TRINITY_DN5874_c0_g1_i1.p1 TRINITY_DN5874_c0_g1~~TRINITY_DN5874_c0_g1_i1.p1  ORF type:complete len:166 (+),score=25.29 TRINITY_DN5874_c0_g1_i1:63-500(+)
MCIRDSDHTEPLILSVEIENKRSDVYLDELRQQQPIQIGDEDLAVDRRQGYKNGILSLKNAYGGFTDYFAFLSVEKQKLKLQNVKTMEQYKKHNAQQNRLSKNEVEFLDEEDFVEFSLKGAKLDNFSNREFIICLLYTSPSPRDS